RHPGWGGSVDSVVNQKNQFEPVGRAGGDWRNLSPGSDAQRAAVGQIIDEIAAGERPDPTGGATYFLNRKISAERGTDFGAGKDQFMSATIGDHTFYRPGLFGEKATPVPSFTVRPGVDPDLIRDMEAANTRKMEALKSDPLGYVSGLRGAPALPAVDWSQPDAAAAALQERQRTAAATSSMFQIGGPAPVLTKPELDTLKATWANGDASTRGRIVGTLGRSLDGDHLRATLEKVAGDDPVFAAAGMLYQQNADLGLSIVRGQSVIDLDKKILPQDKAIRQSVNDYLGSAAGNMPKSRDAIERAALARYADLSAAANDRSGVMDESRLNQALTDVTGGVVEWGGSSWSVSNRKIIPPKPGMSASDFGRLVDGLTDDDLAGMTTGSGTAIKASDFRRLGALHDAGPGRYLVEIGGGFAQGPDKQPFVLDLSKKVAAK
ncbi:MAG: cell wall hydrolase, partial [Alphaproteobacteria bacterium]